MRPSPQTLSPPLPPGLRSCWVTCPFFQVPFVPQTGAKRPGTNWPSASIFGAPATSSSSAIPCEPWSLSWPLTSSCLGPPSLTRQSPLRMGLNPITTQQGTPGPVHWVNLWPRGVRMGVGCGVAVQRVGEQGGSEGERNGVKRGSSQSRMYPLHRWGKLRPEFSSREWGKGGGTAVL